MGTMVRSGPWHVTVSRSWVWNGERQRLILYAPLAKSEFLVSGSADNMMKLWRIATGECVYTWEFPTAIKRVAWT